MCTCVCVRGGRCLGKQFTAVCCSMPRAYRCPYPPAPHPNHALSATRASQCVAHTHSSLNTEWARSHTRYGGGLDRYRFSCSFVHSASVPLIHATTSSVFHEATGLYTLVSSLRSSIAAKRKPDPADTIPEFGCKNSDAHLRVQVPILMGGATTPINKTRTSVNYVMRWALIILPELPLHYIKSHGILVLFMCRDQSILFIDLQRASWLGSTARQR